MLKSLFGTVAEARSQPPLSGVYSFFDQIDPIYIGRTNKRGLGPRMKNHLTPSHNQAVLAFKIAKKKLGLGTVYSGEGTRQRLMGNSEFLSIFRDQIAYVSSLSVRFVEITDSDDQYVFEYYASKRLKTPFNDFDTH
jgi:hypothetical protein